LFANMSAIRCSFCASDATQQDIETGEFLCDLHASVPASPPPVTQLQVLTRILHEHVDAVEQLTSADLANKHTGDAARALLATGADLAAAATGVDQQAVIAYTDTLTQWVRAASVVHARTLGPGNTDGESVADTHWRQLQDTLFERTRALAKQLKLSPAKPLLDLIMLFYALVERVTDAALHVRRNLVGLVAVDRERVEDARAELHTHIDSVLAPAIYEASSKP
jgi:hypothetical protein